MEEDFKKGVPRDRTEDIVKKNLWLGGKGAKGAIKLKTTQKKSIKKGQVLRKPFLCGRKKKIHSQKKILKGEIFGKKKDLKERAGGRSEKSRTSVGEVRPKASGKRTCNGGMAHSQA